MSKYIYALFLGLLCGCASNGGLAAADTDEPVLTRDYFSDQQRCFDSWQAVVDDWVADGGRVYGSITETRLSIAGNRHAKLALLIQKLWKKKPSSIDKRDWQDSRGTALAFSSAVTDEVPAGCHSIVWLQLLLIETPDVFSEGARESLLAEAPAEAREDPRLFSQWLIYMLLVPDLKQHP